MLGSVWSDEGFCRKFHILRFRIKLKAHSFHCVISVPSAARYAAVALRNARLRAGILSKSKPLC